MPLPINRGVENVAVKCCTYGPEGVGKTTFASEWPNAVFIDIEGGSKLYDVARMPTPTSWTMLLEEVAEVADHPREVGTIVIDTADAAERLCKAHILERDGKDGIESYGYGKGYTALAEEFAKLLSALDDCIEAGINALVLAHCQIRKFEQPDEMGAYDRYELKLEKKCAPLVKEWSDLLLFANYKTDVIVDKDSGKAKGTGGTKRVMYTQRRASWDAKNRFGLKSSLPFDFASIEGALFADSVAREHVETAQTAPQPETQSKTPHILDGANIEEVTPENVKKLHALMERDGINEVQLAFAVAENPRNDYTEHSRIADYSSHFVDALVSHWDSVSAKAAAHGAYATDPIPF